MPQPILFDFDGTIADSLQTLFCTYNEVAESMGCQLAHDEDIQKFRGMHAKEILSHLNIPKWKLPFLIKSTLSRFKNKVKSVPFSLNMKEILTHLHSQGRPLHIMSSNSEENIHLFLTNHNIDFFESVLSCGTDLFGRDRYIRKFLKKHQLNPDQLLYIGDEARDIEAAKACNMRIVAVSWGYNTRQKLEKLHPNFLIDSPNELLKIIDR